MADLIPDAVTIDQSATATRNRFAPVPSAMTEHVAEEIRQSLYLQILEECQVMAQHSLAAGIVVPPLLFGRFEDCLAEHAGIGRQEPSPGPLTTSTEPASIDTVRPPQSPPRSRQGLLLQELGEIHDMFVRAVTPAAPATLTLFARERRDHPRLVALGPVAVARNFVILGLGSLVLMLGLALSPDVNVSTLQQTLLELSGGQLLVVELFLLSAASLGACFSNLQKLNGYISAGTYDPKYQGTYWSRWAMGVISGILLSQILYAELIDRTVVHAANNGPSPADFGQPTLAVFGGYSAQLVQRIIIRLIESVETFFSGERPSKETRPLPPP
jgi:hypothetical protein